MITSNLTRRKPSGGDSNAPKEKSTDESTADTAPLASSVPAVMLQALAPMALTILLILCLPVLLGPDKGGAILEKALSRAFRGGIPGFVAALVQIFSLMWLRTTINYQFKTGTPLCKALRTLWAEGGLGRFYRGLLPAIALVPLSRFGDSATNAGVLAVFQMAGSTIVPVAVQTLLASAASTAWRVLLMPLVVLKTTMQVSGAKGLPALRRSIRLNGPREVFFKGTFGTMLAQFMGHYPWFAVHNFLEASIAVSDDPTYTLLRAAAIGCTATIVSDCVTNSIRVVNTYRQTSNEDLTYGETIKRVVNEDGVVGLFTRGLSTKMIANCLNAIIFKVLLLMSW